MKLQLFQNKCPKTSKWFYSYFKDNSDISYNGVKFERLVHNGWIQSAGMNEYISKIHMIIIITIFIYYFILFKQIYVNMCICFKIYPFKNNINI